jgi:hypothetical protein
MLGLSDLLSPDLLSGVGGVHIGAMARGCSLQGLITIRAFNATERFSDKNMVNVDYHMRAEMGQNVASRWLTIRMQFFGAFSLWVTTFGICLYPRSMDAGLTGMVINYALQVIHSCPCDLQHVPSRKWPHHESHPNHENRKSQKSKEPLLIIIRTRRPQGPWKASSRTSLRYLPKRAP